MSAGVLPLLKGTLPSWGYSVEGLSNQARLLRQCGSLQTDQPELLEAFQGLLFWAFECRPLEGEFVNLLLQAGRRHGFLNEQQTRFLQLLASSLRPPAGAMELESRVRSAGDDGIDALMEEAASRLARPEERLYWLGRLWQWSVLHARWTRWPQWFDTASLSEIPLQLQARLQAQARLMEGDWSGAGKAASGIEPGLFDGWRSYVLAEAARIEGNLDEALASFGRLQRSRPWHVNLLLKTHALLRPSGSLPLADSTVTVAMYSWNKAEYLRATLASLLESRLGEARLVMLDNGSSDGTQSVMEEALDRLGRDRARVVRLPVNVGAPPARNWLLSMPEVLQSEAVAFVDDDVELPSDWLCRLLQGARDCPEAGAVGGRVLYVKTPQALQMTDLHLLEPNEETRLPLLNNALGEPDMGLHDFRRPALSVTGCCHLLTRLGLDAVGGFDVRYNPSQLDDLDRDLRLWLSDFMVWYDGGLAVRHHRQSGPGATMWGASGANALGNRLKLETSFSAEDLSRLRLRNEESIWGDIESKARDMSQEFGK